MEPNIKSEREAGVDVPETGVQARPLVRRPYEPPRIESGLAFEQVLLMSGCNSGFFCPIPC